MDIGHVSNSLFDVVAIWLQYGDTPLHTSARYGHAGVMRILISANCRVSEQNKVTFLSISLYIQFNHPIPTGY